MKKTMGLLATLSLSFAMTAGVQAGPRLDQIVNEQVIRVGTPGDYRPFAIQTDNGGYEGHDIEVITAMAEELGWRIEFVPTSWPNLLTDLQADKFDIAVGGITRNAARLGQVEMLPGYAPFGKVALVRKEDANKYTSLEDLNQPDVHVIKNPGGTNEQFVLEYLTQAQVSTHEHNAEIPQLIATGKGDVMITETFEALHYANEDDRLAALFVDSPLTPQYELGFMLPTDDADYIRVMRFAWDLMETRGVLEQAQNNWF